MTLKYHGRVKYIILLMVFYDLTLNIRDLIHECLASNHKWLYTHPMYANKMGCNRYCRTVGVYSNHKCWMYDRNV